MALRVSPTTRVRAEIDTLFGSDRELAAILEDVGRLTVRLVLQQAIEAEVDAFLGRGRYERRDEDTPPGSRNGWQPPVAVRTTMGPISLNRPKLRGTDEKFCSQLFGLGVTRTNALEALVISAWVRGLSDRDVEAALKEALGDEAALSRSTISRICQEIKDEFTAFSTSDLSAHRIDYLFLDGTNFKMHEHAPAEPVLVAWGVDTDGKPQLVGLAAASSESTDAWIGFLEDLTSRGLPSPLLIVSDGAPGLIAAIEHVFPKALRQRCVIHRLRNAVAKVSKADQDMFKADWWAIFDNIEAPPGQLAVNEATRRLDGFRAQWERAYPSAVACLVEDFASLSDLSAHRIDYLFLDGTNFKMHEHAPAEPVLVAWGVDTDGKPQLVGLAAASSESTDAWIGFLEDLTSRGLPSPLLIVSDGAPGLIAAIEHVFPKALRQRCVIHRLRNAVAKVSKADQDMFKADWWAIFDNIEAPPGQLAVNEATRRLDGFRAQWERAYPSAVACLVEDFASLTVHLRFPAEHWKRCRHTNLIERTFGETRRRTKVMGRLPGERTCVALVFAVLDRQRRGWRGMSMTPRALRRLQDLRRELLEKPEGHVVEEPITTAA